MKLQFAEAASAALIQAMEQDSRVFLYGEGINDPYGFFGSTEGLAKRFSEDRCFDVPNSEEALTGLGVGASLMGYRPVFVNLRLEFLLLAMNQMANHAARWSAMSGFQCSLPFTIRALIGKGWGQAAQHSGAFHSVFANFPGLQIVVPGRVEDVGGLLLSCIFSKSPSVFIEEKSLYELTGEVNLPLVPIPLGEAAILQEGSDVTFLAISSMVSFASDIALDLSHRGIAAEVIDLRGVAPMDEAAILRSISKTRKVVVFDIGWPRFGLAAEVARIICAQLPSGLAQPLLNITRKDEHTPASCFLEYYHYPRKDEALRQILALFK